MNVKNTPIYRAIAPRVRKQDRAELAKMLGLAIESIANTHHPYRSESELPMAFAWSETPQGFEYWYELHKRLRA